MILFISIWCLIALIFAVIHFATGGIGKAAASPKPPAQDTEE